MSSSRVTIRWLANRFVAAVFDPVVSVLRTGCILDVEAKVDNAADRLPASAS